jgi:outer membrane protein assembly factor BamB
MFVLCTSPVVMAWPGNYQQKAKQYVDAAGVKACPELAEPGGLIVHLGCGDGKLTVALYTNENCLVHGLDTSLENVAKAREYIQSQNLYGPVLVDSFSGKRLPYADNLVNHVVAQDIDQLPLAEVMRVLIPNGTAYIKSGDKWVKKVKPRSEDIDEWPHWLHGPDNNAVSKDKRVGISRSLQWYMPPNWTRHHNLPAGFNSMVSSGGRIYYMVDTAPNAVYGPGKWVLVARDAFNGLELWRKDITDWHMKAWGAEKRYGGRIGRFHGAPDYQAPRRIVAAGDLLFVTLGFNAPVTVLDGRTGKVLRVFTDTDRAGEIIYRDGILYVARNIYEPERGKEIMAVEARTGKTLWTNSDYAGIAASIGYQKKHTNAFITAGKEHLFLADTNDIVALDMEDGSESWKKPMPLTDEIVGDIDYRYSNFCTLVYHDGTLFFSQIYPGTRNLNRWEMKKLWIEAIDAETGELKWDYTG